MKFYQKKCGAHDTFPREFSLTEAGRFAGTRNVLMTRNIACSILCAIMLSSATAMAQRSWQFISFDPPGSAATNADGINVNGDVVGWYMDSAGKQHGYVLSAGSFTAIDYPGSAAAIARAINDRGDIVGTHVGNAAL